MVYIDDRQEYYMSFSKILFWTFRMTRATANLVPCPTANFREKLQLPWNLC